MKARLFTDGGSRGNPGPAAYGFVLEAESDLLRNPADDRSLNVFDEKIRGQTDRFVLKFRKPQ